MLRRAPKRSAILLTVLLLPGALALRAQPNASRFDPPALERGWRGENHGFATLTVLRQEETFPAELLSAIGTSHVIYDGFLVARVPTPRAGELAQLAWDLGLRPSLRSENQVHGFAGAMDLDAVAIRAATWSKLGIASEKIPGLFWVQFAYPVKNTWREELAGCVEKIVLEAPSRAFLVQSAEFGSVTGCGDLTPLLEAVEPFRNIDKADISVLTARSLQAQTLPGLTLADLGYTRSLGAKLEVDDPQQVRELLADPRVLALSVNSDEQAGPADERQALQLARSWNPGSGEALVPGGGNPTYSSWLPAELHGASGQASIAIFDTGIDNDPILGPPPAPPFLVSHPDLVGRLVGRYDIVQNPASAAFSLPDETGHGSLVASVAVGAGTIGGLGSDGFLKGQGIAPEAKYWFVNRWDYSATSCNGFGTTPSDVLDRVAAGHDWVSRTGPYPATIANHSWAAGTSYLDWVVDGFDRAAIDATSKVEGLQSLLPVVAAGNNSSVTAPGIAKNVLAVGSVDGWVTGSGFCSPTVTDPFNGPFVVSAFSGVGTPFGPASGAPFPRIKPDVVAPGWRADGARPDPILCSNSSNVCSSTSDQASGSFSFAKGTSFAAPAAAGAAALKTKWFRNRGTEPKATLLKAALIATADSLGPVVGGQVACTAGDCRPSYKYGWGLINLDRLVAPTPARFIRNEQIQFDEVGDFWRSVHLVPDDPTLPVYIVLVWNDIPNATGSSSANATLKRDLDLSVEDWYGKQMGTGYFVGNNFGENIIGLDTGYSQPFGFWNGSIVDTNNTVEAVFIEPSSSYASNKSFRIVVIDRAHAASTEFPLQSFSIYAWNAKQP